KLSGTGTLTIQKQPVDITLDEYQVPGKSARQEIGMMGMKLAQIAADGKVTMLQGAQKQELPAPMQRAALRSLWRDPNFILIYASQPKATVRALPPIKDGAATFDAIEVTSPDGDATRVLFDPKTHLIARMIYEEDGKSARIELSDYRAES